MTTVVQTNKQPNQMQKKAPAAPASKPDVQTKEESKAKPPTKEKHAWQKRLASMPPSRRLEKQVKNLQRRCHKMFKGSGVWSADLEKCMANVVEFIDQATKAAIAIPDDHKPAGKSAVREHIAAGNKVSILDKAFDRYSDIIEKGDATGLTVEKIVGGKLIVKTQSGVKLLCQRGHLKLEA